jgi:hypothetical protein
LPPADLLNFDYEFFNRQQKPEELASQTNYFNARVRVAVIQVITEFILTPPVTAFSLALHTVPSPQPDGSYLWVYTYVDGEEEAQIRLRGKPVGNRVEWELRVSSTEGDPPFTNELWFDGETVRDGRSGFLRFHDFNLDGKPVIARIDWNADSEVEELEFTDLYENPGDKLSFQATDALHTIDFLDASESEVWFIRWNPQDGSGSLRAPDYNNAQEACWDRRQEDVACATDS